jgi:hypothetical protein
MYAYVCMHVCMHVCIQLAEAFSDVDALVSVSVEDFDGNRYVCMYVSECVCMHMHVCMYACMHVCFQLAELSVMSTRLFLYQ